MNIITIITNEENNKFKMVFKSDKFICILKN